MFLRQGKKEPSFTIESHQAMRMHSNTSRRLREPFYPPKKIQATYCISIKVWWHFRPPNFEAISRLDSGLPFLWRPDHILQKRGYLSFETMLGWGCRRGGTQHINAHFSGELLSFLQYTRPQSCHFAIFPRTKRRWAQIKCQAWGVPQRKAQGGHGTRCCHCIAAKIASIYVMKVA